MTPPATLILLTYNERAGVQALLPRIPLAAFDECLAVDGGSTDGTIEQLKAHGLRVVGQARRGRGEAFRVGVDASQGEHLVFFSPDGNEDPEDILRLLGKLRDGYDIAIASRFLPGARNEEQDSPLPLRMWANQGFSGLANMVWSRGTSISDTINGFRGITRSAFQQLRLDVRGFVIEYQMSIRAMKLGLQVAEIPTHECPRIGGESKAKTIRTGLDHLRTLLREWWIGRHF